MQILVDYVCRWCFFLYRYGWTHCRYSWWWGVVNKDFQVGHLLLSSIQCLLNCMFRNTCIRICIVLSFQLSHCQMPILHYHTGRSSMPFFIDNAWMSNFLVSTAAFTIIYLPFINTNNSKNPQLYSFRDACSESSGHCNQPSIKFA